MYKILQPDGTEEGPLDLAALRERIQLGQITAQARAQTEGMQDWKPLSEFPELSEIWPPQPSIPTPPPPLLAPRGSPPPPLPIPSARPSAMPGVQRRRTSRLAIASFVLGVLGVCTAGLSAVVGVVLGILAVRQIKESQGQLAGRGFAWAGFWISALSLICVAIALSFALPAIAKENRQKTLARCTENLKQVALAIRLQAEEKEGKFPAGANWCDVIAHNLQSVDLLKCPARDQAPCGYAYNRNIAGRTVSSVPPDTVMLLESNRGWNGTSGPEEPAGPSSHGHAYSVAFADGSVRQVDVRELPALRWEP